MTLRLRLIALLVALAALLALGEWLLVRKLSADLQLELGAAAEAVGRDVLRLLGREGDLPAKRDAAAGGGPGVVERRILVLRESSTELIDGPPAAATGSRDVARNETEGPTTRAPVAIGRSPAAAPAAGGAAAASPPPTRLEERVEVRVAREPPPRGALLGAPEVLVYRGSLPPKRVAVPTGGVDDAVDRFARRLLLASLALFAGALLLGIAVTHRFTRPLHHLAAAARQVGAGELGVSAPAAPGEVGGAIAAFNQMSRRLRELGEEARRLRASEQLSELGEVGRGLAHSLRNPLNALGLALEELAADHGADGRGEIADAARRQIRRIDAALRGFLALAAGEAPVAQVDLAAVARDVALELLQARPASEGVPRLAVDAAAGDTLTLGGIEAELRAALQALAVNAVEASPPGEPVTLGLRRDGDAVVIAVEDRGAGVPPEVQARLFTPHVTTKPAGAGVGLYLAHRLATTRYGGELAVEPRPGGGTRATLRLRDRGTPGGSGSAAAAPADASGRAAEPPRGFDGR